MLRSDQKVSRFSLLTKITGFATLGYPDVRACRGTRVLNWETGIVDAKMQRHGSIC
jgi:hypothetical protein